MKHYQIIFAVLLMGTLACSFSSTSQEGSTDVDSVTPGESPTSTKSPTSEAVTTPGLPPSVRPLPTSTPLAPEFINAPVPDGAIARISRGYIQNVVISPDGQYLALATTTGLYLHELDSFKEIWNIPFPGNITSLTFSPDSSLLALGTDTGKVIYLDSGVISREIQVSDIEIGSISWSPDRNYVVATTKDKAYVLDGNGQIIKEINLPGGSEQTWQSDSRQTWLLDSSQLYLMDYQTINLISFEEEIKLIDTINVDVGEPYAVLPSTDGLQLFANGTMYRWEGQAFHQEFTITYEPLPGVVGSTSWSPDGKYVAISDGFSDYLVIFDVEKGEEIHRLQTGLIYNHLLFFGADSKTLFYGTPSGILEWQVESGQLLKRLEGYTHSGSDWSTAPNCISWSPDGASMLIGYGSFEFIQLDAFTFERTHHIPLRDWPYQFTWSDDGTFLYVGQLNPYEGAIGTVWKAEAETFEQVQSIPSDTYYGYYIFQWSPGGDLYVIQDDIQNRDVLGVYDSKNLNRLWSFPQTPLFSFSPDSNRLGTIGDNRLTIYDARTGGYVQSIAFEIESADEMGWAPDGAHIAVGYRDIEGISIYDLSTGTRSLALEAGSGPIAYSPSGNVIAVGSDKGLVYLYDAVSGRLLRTLDGHTYSITALAWKPDATQLASGSQDGTVVIWNLAS